MSTTTPASIPPAPPEDDTGTLELGLPPAPPADPLPGKAPRRPRARKPAGDKPATPARRGRPARAQTVDIAGRMAGLYVQAGVLVSMAPSGPAQGSFANGRTITQLVGMQVATQAEACGEAWAKLAADNTQVRDALERFLTVSVFAELIAAHMPILLLAGIGTGYIPDDLAVHMLASMGQDQAQEDAQP